MTAPASMTIPLKTLTPIHTGDADMKTSYLRATSFLGGLRFWTEALLRSIGEDVCNISDDKTRCLHDGKNNHACAACNIFGCTGLGRSFIMRVENANTQQTQPKVITLGSLRQWCTPTAEYLRNLQRKNKPEDIYYVTAGMIGAFTLRLIASRPELARPDAPRLPPKLDSCLLTSLLLLLKYGTLGAQDQYGKGLVQCTSDNAISELQELSKRFLSEAKTHSSNDGPFSDFFFFTAQAKEHADSLSFAIRWNVRNALREKYEDLLRHYFCGTFGRGNEDPKNATKYNITMHSGRISGWGWFPKQGPHGDSRDRCLDVLRKQVQGHAQELQWREFDSPRDPASKGLSWQEYLGNLVTADWPR